MTLQQLAYFLAVARTRHFTRAAEEVRVAQPSLSQQIRALERELGAELFSRARGNVTLTPAGEALLPVAGRILSDVDTARLEVAELVGLRRGRVRVGATPSLCGSLFADVIKRYHDAHPGIRVSVTEGGSRDLVRALEAGDLDLALVIVSPSDAHRALTVAPVLREELVVASARPLGVDRLRLTDLEQHPLVMFRPGYDLRETTLAACRGAGFEPQFAVEGGEMDAVLRFVEVGLGVAIVPSTVLAARSLHGTPLAPSTTRTVGLAHRADVAPTNAARAFRNVLLAFLRGAEMPSGVHLATP
ncbi:LysR family transcriptional regulator [Saccharothrix algeriensis]|uniref:DNA-binding transcriptional LysR family regulator n=1 Tax=Saccharothrix algeriensis TaxID=173560 RepID=A0A8T8HTT3_9PSEU|nr:LysR substrate-binding domain-containing protein [Saccharothrix algeriensis]MBM7813273.1 DNA-binding transcriptional LysR family regulator [Saccharothrix algeriensis]QTR01827.1 LysR family transcriptional regulator [Saccharothrix algeriensis]